RLRASCLSLEQLCQELTKLSLPHFSLPLPHNIVVQFPHSSRSPLAQHQLNPSLIKARILLSLLIVNNQPNSANMKHFHLKKCPLCGQSLRKTKGKCFIFALLGWLFTI